jgi:hypothetical protein
MSRPCESSTAYQRLITIFGFRSTFLIMLLMEWINSINMDCLGYLVQYRSIILSLTRFLRLCRNLGWLLIKFIVVEETVNVGKRTFGYCACFKNEPRGVLNQHVCEFHTNNLFMRNFKSDYSIKINVFSLVLRFCSPIKRRRRIRNLICYSSKRIFCSKIFKNFPFVENQR